MASTSAYASLKALVVGAVTPLGVYDYDEIEPVLQQGSALFAYGSVRGFSPTTDPVTSPVIWPRISKRTGSGTCAADRITR